MFHTYGSTHSFCLAKRVPTIYGRWWKRTGRGASRCIHRPSVCFVGDRYMWPFYETCQDLGIPIVSHSGPARGGEPYGEPGNFAAALEAFPRLTIVLAHMGGATWQQCVDIAHAYSNVYFDICEIIAWTGGTNAPTNQQLGQLVKDVGPERVMMGSDFPWYDLDYTVQQIMELPVLSNEEKEGILGANAERILGL